MSYSQADAPLYSHCSNTFSTMMAAAPMKQHLIGVGRWRFLAGSLETVALSSFRPSPSTASSNTRSLFGDIATLLLHVESSN